MFKEETGGKLNFLCQLAKKTLLTEIKIAAPVNTESITKQHRLITDWEKVLLVQIEKSHQPQTVFPEIKA